MSLRKYIVCLTMGLAVAACTQGSDIAAPGATDRAGKRLDAGQLDLGSAGRAPDVVGAAACPSGFTTGTAVGGLTACILSGDILTNLTLPFVEGTAYRIDGRVNVGVDVGADGNAAGGVSARLTIEPGVTIFGADGADYIVVNRGSQMEVRVADHHDL